MSRTLAIAALALGALAGCTKARTEAVVIVATDGVRVPDDVDALTLVVADTTDPTNPLFSKSFRVCGGDVTSDCFTLPLDFTLVPGPHRDHSSRVQITATRHATPVIDDAAIFTFAEGQSLRLDFVLYANCLGNTDCASRDQACGPDAMCQPVPANPMSGEPDLSVGPADLAVADDLASTPDLATPPIDLSVPVVDLARPIDLALPADMAMCTPSCPANFCGTSCGMPCTCLGNHVCQASVCVACGALGQPCCVGNMCNTGVSCNVGTNVCEQSGSDGGTADQVLTWSSQSLDGGAFYGVWGVAGTVFAVGNFAGSSAVFLNSSTTNPLAFAADTRYSGMGTLYSVYGRSATDVFAGGGSGVLIHFNGTTWSDAGAALSTSVSVLGLWAGGPNDDVWAVGGNSTPTYLIAQHDSMVFPTGAHWDSSLGNGAPYNAVWADGLGKVFEVGTEDQNRMTTTNDNHNFSAWIMSPSTSQTIYGIFGVSSSLLYAVGTNGVVWRIDASGAIGTTKETLSPAATPTLYGISGTPGSLWAVGTNNSIYHSTGDGNWILQTNVPTPANFTTFRGVFARGPNDVYVVGNIMGTKVILHGQ